MAGKRRSLDFEIRQGKLPQGYELAADDVGHRLGALGLAQTGDIGKRVWVRSYGMVMENAEQRDQRKVIGCGSNGWIWHVRPHEKCTEETCGGKS